MKNKVEYVAVFPDHPEVFMMLDADEIGKTFCPLKRFAEDAVRKAGIRCPRKDPFTVKVETFRIGTKDGKLGTIWMPARTITVQPYLERMTHEEYNEEKYELLKQLPEAFHDFVANHAYEHGHSSGYEDVIGCLTELVDGLKPCIAKYNKTPT